MRRDAELPRGDVAVHLKLVLPVGVERRVPGQEGVDEDAEGPPVYRLRVPLQRTEEGVSRRGQGKAGQGRDRRG